jgi:NTE family protein
MAHASTYPEWYALAMAFDERVGALDWRACDRSDLMHTELIRRQMHEMRRLREQGDGFGVIDALQESLYRHLTEFSNPALYQRALSGTKFLVTDYLEEVEACMMFLCRAERGGINARKKLRRFLQAEKLFGQPALMLSGGAVFGIFHLGVIKGLWENGLLPRVISGSSMGAIVGTWACCRNEVELRMLLEDPCSVLNREALRFLLPAEALEARALMDQPRLLRHIVANAGSYTFREAYRHSGRILNISVSPTSKRQKPRVLNWLTAPEALVEYAALASSAIPGAFPPVRLQARRNGEVRPYIEGETWVDGSVADDMPMGRMSRLLNTNLFIASQANPHVIPFIRHYRSRGLVPGLQHVGGAFVHANLAASFSLAKDYLPLSPLRTLFEKFHSLTAQTYMGDINVQMPFQAGLYRKLMRDPSEADLRLFVRLGERETWPRIEMIRNQTRVHRMFETCIADLKRQMRQDWQAGD